MDGNDFGKDLGNLDQKNGDIYFNDVGNILILLIIINIIFQILNT